MILLPSIHHILGRRLITPIILFIEGLETRDEQMPKEPMVTDSSMESDSEDECMPYEYRCVCALERMKPMLFLTFTISMMSSKYRRYEKLKEIDFYDQNYNYTSHVPIRAIEINSPVSYLGLSLTNGTTSSFVQWKVGNLFLVFWTMFRIVSKRTISKDREKNYRSLCFFFSHYWSFWSLCHRIGSKSIHSYILLFRGDQTMSSMIFSQLETDEEETFERVFDEQTWWKRSLRRRLTDFDSYTAGSFPQRTDFQRHTSLRGSWPP